MFMKFLLKTILILSVFFASYRALGEQKYLSTLASFFSSSSTPTQLLRIRQLWGIENLMRMREHYEDNFSKGHYIHSYSHVVEDAFTISGFAYDFFGYSTPYAVPLSFLYWGFYLSPGWFYRLANFSYASLDGNLADLPLEEFHFEASKYSTDYSHSAILKCDYYASKDDIVNNHKPLFSNLVYKKNIPPMLIDMFQYFRNNLVLVPGRWLRTGPTNSSFQYAAFGTLQNPASLETACALEGMKQGYPNLENLIPVVTVENNSWMGSYPVYFYVEALKKLKDGKEQKIAAKLVPDSVEIPKEHGKCICPKCPAMDSHP